MQKLAPPLLVVIALFTVATVYTQTPQAFKYQAVVRDAAGSPLANHSLQLRAQRRHHHQPYHLR